MAEMTPLQMASEIHNKVEAVMKHYVLLQVRSEVLAAVADRLPDAIRYVVGGGELNRLVKEILRDEFAGKLKVSVEIVEPEDGA